MSSRGRWIIVWILALLPLLGWWLYGLFDIDEGFYGSITAEMNRRGEWITPLYNGKPWFEKPILLYWMAKPCLMAFGDMVGPRLPSILSALGTYVMIAWFANRRFGEKTAQLATLMLASSLLVIGTARMMMTDMPLVLCLTAAMVTFWESLVSKSTWRIWTAGLLGLGVLAKGPVALILFAIIAGWTYWREPAMRPSFRGSWLQSTVLMVCVIATWYVPAYLKNGQLFVQKFLIEQNIGRFTGGDAAHTLPGISGLLAGAGMYVAILLLGMMPWSLFIWKAWPRRAFSFAPLDSADFSNASTLQRTLTPLPPSPPDSATLHSPSAFAKAMADKSAFAEAMADKSAGLGSITNQMGEGGELDRYLATWAGVVFIFFTISGAKLVHYILPMFPPLSILVAGYAIKASKKPMRWFYAAGISCVVMSCVANGVFLWWYQASGQAEVHAIARYLRKEGGAVAMYQMGRRNKDLGTGKPKLQETSLPSVLLYLDKNVLDTDEFSAILSAKSPIWIITRDNRIQLADFVAAQRVGKELAEVKPPVKQDAFKLYLVR